MDSNQSDTDKKNMTGSPGFQSGPEGSGLNTSSSTSPGSSETPSTGNIASSQEDAASSPPSMSSPDVSPKPGFPSSTPSTSPPSSTTPTQAAPPPTTPPPTDSTVVEAVPKKQALPFWFYLLFAVVAITFFVITALLAQSIINKNKSSQSALNKPVTQNQTATTDKELTPSVEPTPVDSFVEQTDNVSQSDELDSIEGDLNATDLKPLDQDLQNLDATINQSP